MLLCSNDEVAKNLELFPKVWEASLICALKHKSQSLAHVETRDFHLQWVSHIYEYIF